MASIAENQAEIVEEFAMFESWMDKYEYLIGLGKDLPAIDQEHLQDDNLIKGCQSRVWLHAELNSAGNVEFTADSDAIITKGLVAMMIRALSNQPAVEIAKADMGFLDDIGLKDHLSPTRSNGLLSMVKQMKLYGLAYSARS